MEIESLHAHTTNSDGKQTYDQVLATARSCHINIIAFTDHDTVMPIGDVQRLKDKQNDVKWISGIEISSALPIELGSMPHSKFHIVGLFVDPTNRELIDYCKGAAEDKMNRGRQIVRSLKELGFDITFENVLKRTSGMAVGYPHIVEALMDKETNQRKIEVIRKDMERESKHNPKFAEKFAVMMQSGTRQYPYTLLFSEEAFIPGIYISSKFQRDFDESVRLIRDAGGLALLAHYYSVSEIISPDLLDNFIKDGRLDGLETVFGLFAFVEGNQSLHSKERQIVLEVSARHTCLQGGGADSHSQQDLLNFAVVPQLATRTRGMTEAIVRKRGNSDWSTI